MKALMSPFARSVLRNLANHDAIRKTYEAGYGRENAVTVTVTPMDKDDNLQQPVVISVYKVPHAQP